MIIPIPGRRKLGAAALIAAGIGAFLVPFLLHSPTTQGTSNNNNNNNGSHTTTTTTTPSPTPGTNGGGNSGSGGGTGSTGTCSEDQAKDPSPTDNGNGQHKGNAYGVLANQLDKTVALVKAMGTHNTAFHAHHDTKTDNDTVHGHKGGSEDLNDHDSACAEKEETNDY
jgi:hypothetical protein